MKKPLEAKCSAFMFSRSRLLTLSPSIPFWAAPPGPLAFFPSISTADGFLPTPMMWRPSWRWPWTITPSTYLPGFTLIVALTPEALTAFWIVL